MVCLDYFEGVKFDGGCSWLLCLSWYIFIFPLLVTVYTIKIYILLTYCAWSTEVELVQQACLMVCSPVVYTIVV